MRISHEMVNSLCQARGLTLKEVLNASGVSSNAYYSLARKESVLPQSVEKLAATLGVPVSKLLIDEEAILERHLKLLAEVDRIAATDEQLDRDTIRHTLLLLEEPPITRLRRALALGRHSC